MEARATGHQDDEELAAVVEHAVPAFTGMGESIAPRGRFQALRIAVNRGWR